MWRGSCRSTEKVFVCFALDFRSFCAISCFCALSPTSDLPQHTHRYAANWPSVSSQCHTRGLPALSHTALILFGALQYSVIVNLPQHNPCFSTVCSTLIHSHIPAADPCYSTSLCRCCRSLALWHVPSLYARSPDPYLSHGTCTNYPPI